MFPPRNSFNSQTSYSFFQKGKIPDEIIKESVELEDEDAADFSRIRCPLCQWQPSKSSFWWCMDCYFPEYFFESCGTAWNTFETRGACPGCRHQWRWTSCLRCAGWSLHEDWYVKKIKD